MALLERSDQILGEIRVEPFAYHSKYSPSGFELRLERYGQRLYHVLNDSFDQIPEDLLALANDVLNHQQAYRSNERTIRVEMSLRLLGWLLQRKENKSTSFEQAAKSYASDGGFVDWARHCLYGGEGVAALANAYSRLVEIVTEKREAENKRFGGLLANWTEIGSPGDSLLLIENVLKEIGANAARSRPVLLIVMDGMGFAVFRELIEDVVSQGWVEQGIAGKNWPRPVIAALPSITEVSRTSLLCGRLALGSSGDEVNGFKTNADLLEVSRSGYPPVLFHKSNLTDSGSADLAADMRKEIASDKRKIVGAVINAVDDHLMKGEQIVVPWTLKHVPVLEQLLYAARDAGRVVILTSDHGHILDRQTVYRKNEPGERFRINDEPPLPDELVVSGSRVLAASGCFIAPWSEMVRYGVKKHGYHGGITPQECVVPLAVLSRQNQPLDGWEELPPYYPDWWYIASARVVVQEETSREAPTTLETVSPRALASDAERLPFFAIPEVSPLSRREVWIKALLESPTYASQNKLLGRSAPSPGFVRSFLSALHEHGGKMLRPALAQALEQPEQRMSEIISAMRRLLNVDGYPVLSVDASGTVVVLNRELLTSQFELS